MFFFFTERMQSSRLYKSSHASRPTSSTTMELGKSQDQLVCEEPRGPRGAWQRRTPLEKALLVMCGVTLLACMALVGVVAAAGSSNSSSAPAPMAG